MYRRLVPEIELQGEVNGHCHIKINGGLTYVGVEYFTTKVREIAMVNSHPAVLVLDCSNMFECDFTVTQGLLGLYYECQDRDVLLIFYNVQTNVKEMLENTGLPAEIFHSDLPDELSGLLKT